jgi:putative ABC transport system permease protein
MVLGEGLRLSAFGLLAGLAGAYLVGRGMQSLLYGVNALDLTAFGVVAAILMGSALLACCIPARRAVSVDPMVALRED